MVETARETGGTIPFRPRFAPTPVEAAKSMRALARSIVLVGIMGSGKDLAGRRLAERLGLPFVDADAEIEAAQC